MHYTVQRKHHPGMDGRHMIIIFPLFWQQNAIVVLVPVMETINRPYAVDCGF